MTTRRAPSTVAAVLLALGLAAAVTACGGDATEPAPTVDTPAASATVSAPDRTDTTALPEPAVTAAEPEIVPGAPCEPGSHPDCSNDTGSEGDTYRYIDGYGDCLIRLGQDGQGGLCADLDGDDVAGYPDHG